MHDERSHPLLQQTPLTVNPFLSLPTPPTLPPNYASLPSTLPPSNLNAAPTSSAPDLPAYVTSTTGGFAAHPSTIAAQNRSLLEQLEKQKEDGRREVEAWEREIRERELRERRRRAPGWLDREEKLLEPVKAGGDAGGVRNVMDEEPQEKEREKEVTGEDLGAAMDRAFGRSEMG